MKRYLEYLYAIGSDYGTFRLVYLGIVECSLGVEAEEGRLAHLTHCKVNAEHDNSRVGQKRNSLLMLIAYCFSF